jgi:hypothetical protein
MTPQVVSPENFGVTMAEIKEYLAIKKQVYASGCMFVELDFSNPLHVRLNSLTGKMLPLLRAATFSQFETWNRQS